MDSLANDALLKGPAKESRFPGRRPCQLFSDIARSHPEALALKWQDAGSCKEYEMTMEELDRKSNKLARGILRHCSQLVKQNNDGDHVVVVYFKTSWKFVCTILAIWKAGCCYLPVEPPAPKERVKYILQDAKPFLVIADSDGEEDLFPGVNTISWNSLEQISIDLADTNLSCEDNHSVKSDPIEIIFYTSGSTGLPKGVRLKSSSIINRLEWQWRRFPFRKEENCCFKTSITFVDSMAEVWAPLLNPEGPLPVLILTKCTSSNPQLLIPLLNRYEISRLILAPTLLKSILTYLKITNDNTSLRQLKMWIGSGETVAYSLAEEFFDWSERSGGSRILCNFYGTTELTADASFHVMENKKQIGSRGKVSIGKPVDNTFLYLLDTQMRFVNSGEIGELYVAGKPVAASYVNGSNSSSFIENPYTSDPEYEIMFKTGDYASVYNGTLIFEGRTDSQVKVRGNRIDMSEIESALYKLQEVEKVVILCYNRDQEDQELLGFVLLKEGASSEPNEIQEKLTESLPSYAIPQVIIVDQIPLLISGKVDRQQLIRNYTQLAKSTNGIDFLLNGESNEIKPAMRNLLSAVSSVIPNVVHKLSPEANFYKIGGNSFNSILTIAQLNEAGYYISVFDFINSETLREIAYKMTTTCDGGSYNRKKVLNKYKFDVIKEKYKADIYRIISQGFMEKSLLPGLLNPPVQLKNYTDFLDSIWPLLIKTPLSIVIMNIDTDEVIGACVAMNTAEEKTSIVQSSLRYVFRFNQDELYNPVMKTLNPKGKKILNSLLMSTDLRLSPQENIEVMEAMEWEMVHIARQNGFNGIITINSHPLTQQLAATVLNYKEMKRAQLNLYIAPDGTRPFGRGDDSVVSICSYKEID